VQRVVLSRKLTGTPRVIKFSYNGHHTDHGDAKFELRKYELKQTFCGDRRRGRAVTGV